MTSRELEEWGDEIMHSLEEYTGISESEARRRGAERRRREATAAAPSQRGRLQEQAGDPGRDPLFGRSRLFESEPSASGIFGKGSTLFGPDAPAEPEELDQYTRAARQVMSLGDARGPERPSWECGRLTEDTRPAVPDAALDHLFTAAPSALFSGPVQEQQAAERQDHSLDHLFAGGQR